MKRSPPGPAQGGYVVVANNSPPVTADAKGQTSTTAGPKTFLRVHPRRRHRHQGGPVRITGDRCVHQAELGSERTEARAQQCSSTTVSTIPVANRRVRDPATGSACTRPNSRGSGDKRGTDDPSAVQPEQERERGQHRVRAAARHALGSPQPDAPGWAVSNPTLVPRPPNHRLPAIWAVWARDLQRVTSRSVTGHVEGALPYDRHCGADSTV